MQGRQDEGADSPAVGGPASRGWGDPLNGGDAGSGENSVGMVGAPFHTPPSLSLRDLVTGLRLGGGGFVYVLVSEGI